MCVCVCGECLCVSSECVCVCGVLINDLSKIRVPTHAHVHVMYACMHVYGNPNTCRSTYTVHILTSDTGVRTYMEMCGSAPQAI